MRVEQPCQLEETTELFPASDYSYESADHSFKVNDSSLRGSQSRYLRSEDELSPIKPPSEKLR